MWINKTQKRSWNRKTQSHNSSDLPWLRRFSHRGSGGPWRLWKSGRCGGSWMACTRTPCWSMEDAPKRFRIMGTWNNFDVFWRCFQTKKYRTPKESLTVCMAFVEICMLVKLCEISERYGIVPAGWLTHSQCTENTGDDVPRDVPWGRINLYISSQYCAETCCVQLSLVCKILQGQSGSVLMIKRRLFSAYLTGVRTCVGENPEWEHIHSWCPRMGFELCPWFSAQITPPTSKLFNKASPSQELNVISRHILLKLFNVDFPIMKSAFSLATEEKNVDDLTCPINTYGMIWMIANTGRCILSG